jgi:hypothetical protein
LNDMLGGAYEYNDNEGCLREGGKTVYTT